MWLPRPREEVFAFFADLANLEAITPPHLHFTNAAPGVVMKQGAVLEHRLRLHGFPLRWVSEITEWQPPHRFVDVQRHGPYRVWNHEHTFEERDGGTVVRDCVRYSVPGGTLVQRLFVGPDLKRVFDYRYEKLREMLGG